jgi:hypothetical protein
MGLTVVEIQNGSYAEFCNGLFVVLSSKSKLLTNQSGGTSVSSERDLYFEACLHHTPSYVGSEHDIHPHRYLDFPL